MNQIYEVLGNYGWNWRAGVLIDNLRQAQDLGLNIRRIANTTFVDSDADGEAGRAYVVMCGDFIPIQTEDGTIDGRCGGAVHADTGACEGHAAERDAWNSLSEAEKVWLERREDEERMYG